MKMRHIAWFNEASVEPSVDGALTSADGVVSRRCLAPAREIEKLGVECSIFGNLRDADPVHVSKHLQKLNADIVIIGRISGPSMLKLARAAKHLGCYVIVDCGDAAADALDYAKLAEIADQFVGATAAAVATLAKHAPVLLIPDCDEETGGKNTPGVIAKLWVECFKKLKLKPPACANTNEPTH